MLPKFLIAGILIQASWFLVWAVVDIERVATVGMSGLPSVVIGQNNSVNQALSYNHTALHRKITLNKSSNPCEWYTVETNPITPAPTVEQTLDAVLPRPDTFAGPLMFIWWAILDIPTVEYSDYQFSGDRWDIAIYAAFDIIKAIAFTFAMFAFALLNLIRIAYLWVFIALSPFVVLALVFKDLFSKIGENNIFPLKPQKMLMYIFQPTIMVTLLSVILIVVVLMQNAIINHDIMGMDLQSLIDSNWEVYRNDLFEIAILGTQLTIGKIILWWFSLFLIFGLIMISGKLMGNNFVGNLTRQSLKLFTSIPLAPVKAASNKMQDDFAEKIWYDDRRQLGQALQGNLDINRRNQLKGNTTGWSISAQNWLTSQYEKTVGRQTGSTAKESFMNLTKQYISDKKVTNLFADATWSGLFRKHLENSYVRSEWDNIKHTLDTASEWNKFTTQMDNAGISVNGTYNNKEAVTFTIKEAPAPTNTDTPPTN